MGGFAPSCCEEFETRLQVISHISWPLSCMKERLSTPLHISNPQAIIEFQTVVLTQSFANPNQTRHKHIHITHSNGLRSQLLLSKFLFSSMCSCRAVIHLYRFFCFVPGGPGAHSFVNTHVSGISVCSMHVASVSCVFNTSDTCIIFLRIQYMRSG